MSKLKIQQKNISLCVGGGGANGFSAVPIINEILQQDCKIIAISGCSVGAIIGAYLAKFGEINSLNQKLISYSKIDWLKLVDFTNPLKSMIKGNKIKEFLYHIFKDTTFEELQTPLIIVATNISTKKSEYFRKGKLIDAIMASISVPGIFMPYNINEDFFLDGMLSENVPISPLYTYSNNIIAIDFFYNETINHDIPKTLIESLVLSFTLMVTQKSRELQFEDTIFLFSPKKQNNFAMIEFYNAQSIYQLGVEEVENKKDEFKNWLNRI